MNLWVELSPLFAKIFEASPIEILHVSQMHSSLKGSSKRIKREIHNQINPVSLVRKVSHGEELVRKNQTKNLLPHTQFLINVL